MFYSVLFFVLGVYKKTAWRVSVTAATVSALAFLVSRRVIRVLLRVIFFGKTYTKAYETEKERLAERFYLAAARPVGFAMLTAFDRTVDAVT